MRYRYAMLCHVALCTPPFTTLTYATPEGFPGFDWKPGLRVAVPLGNGAIRVGVVTAVFPDGDKRAFAGASAGQWCFFSLLCSQHSGFVVGGRFPLLKGNGIHGTGRQTIAQAVAVILPEQLRLASYNANGTLVTGIGAQTAAIAFIFIDGNNPSNHSVSSLYGGIFMVVL